MGYAAVQESENNNLAKSRAVNISLIVNVHGKVCLIHDEPFGHTALWVKYLHNRKAIQILFDNGGSLVLENIVPASLNSYLVNTNKVKLIRIENKLPIEAWETFLLNDEYN